MRARRAGVEDLEILLPLFVEPACLGESRQFLFERLSNLQSVIFLTIDEREAPSGFAQLYPSYNSLSVCSPILSWMWLWGTLARTALPLSQLSHSH
jgi:hypothetical protein